MVSTEFWWENDTTWCYCNLDICWQFFNLISSFFEYDDDSKNSPNSNNTETCYALGVTIEEEHFWIRIIECKNDEQLENFFNFLSGCFDGFQQPVFCLDCFCLCHKNVWLPKFVNNNDFDELDLETELKKLEERVLNKNSISDETGIKTGFQIPVIGQLLFSPMTINENNDREENPSKTSEWSIEISEKYTKRK